MTRRIPHAPASRGVPASPCRLVCLVAALLVAVLLVAALPDRARAIQELCPDGRISRVSIETHSIFDLDELSPESRLLWAYRLANTVHVPTREDFIAGSLLFAEGDCYDRAELTESERVLREFRFIARADVQEREAPGGGREILVSTRDEWTTKLSLRVRVEGGIRFEGASVIEENLLGRGVTLGAFLIDRDEHREAGLAVEVPAIAGRHLDALLRVGRTRAGGAVRQAFVRPFVGERPGFAFRQGIDVREDLFSYVVGGGEGISHLLIPFTAQHMELSAARRVGAPGTLYLYGGGVSLERIDVGSVDRVEGVRDGDFSVREPAPSEFSQRLASQFESRRAVRINALVGLRSLQFEARHGLDALAGVQDVPVGHEAVLTFGRAVGGSGPVHGGDFFSRVGILGGMAGERVVGQASWRTEGRWEDAGVGRAAGATDILSEAQGIMYLRPPGALDQTIVLRGAMQGGWRTTTPFQLTLGGPDGVRGFSEAELPGGRRAVVSLESRIRASGPFADFMDLGVTIFGDVGAVWKGDAPYAIDSGVRGTVGAGLRLGFPAGTSSVIRADLGFPVGPGASGRGPILRISAVEYLGVVGQALASQLQSGRRSGIEGEYLGVGRDGPGR